MFQFSFPIQGAGAAFPVAANVDVRNRRLYELPLVLRPPQSGTFFSLQLTNIPPLPTHPLGFPVYALGDAFVFDDLEFDWTAARAQGISLFGSTKYQSGAIQMEADEGPPVPGEGDGGGGSSTNIFPPAYNYTNGDYTNGEFFVQVDSADTNWVNLSLHNSQPTYYRLWSKESLNDYSWTSEGLLLGAADTNVTLVANPTLDRSHLFFRVEQLPQVVRINFTDTFVSTNVVPATIEGNPTSYSIVINDTNFAAATWTAFSSSNIAVTLGVTNGNYDVWFGSINGTTNWSVTRLVLDTVAPNIMVTAPSGSTGSSPLIQLQGYSLEALAKVRYTVTTGREIFRKFVAFTKRDKFIFHYRE